jgi:uncharacterized paraquat-inducible protein A
MKIIQSAALSMEQLKMFVSAPVRKERLDICRSCEYAVSLPLISQKQCSVCKCVIELKTAVKATSCPKDKWHESTSDYQQEQP